MQNKREHNIIPNLARFQAFENLLKTVAQNLDSDKILQIINNFYEKSSPFEKELCVRLFQKQMFVAMEEKQINYLKAILRSNVDIDVDAQNENQKTLIYLVANKQQAEWIQIIDCLLPRGAKIQTITQLGNLINYMFVTIQNSSRHITQFVNNYLINSIDRASIDLKLSLYNSIISAIQFKSIESLKGFFASNFKIDVNEKIINKKSLFWHAISQSNDNVEIFEIFLAQGADIANPIEDGLGSNALHVASVCKALNIVNKLIDLKVDTTNNKNKYNFTAFQFSLVIPCLNIVKLLYPYTSLPSAEIQSNILKLLHTYVCENHAEGIAILKWLVEVKHFNVNVTGGDIGTALLHPVVYFGNMEVIDYLVEHDADINLETFGGQTPLSLSFDNDHRDIQQYLLLRPDLQIKRHKDLKPYLHLAAVSSDIEIIQLLINKGCDINELDDEGKPALSEAIIAGNYEVASFLILMDAEVNVVDKNYNSPLLYAIWTGSIKLVGELLNSNAKLEPDVKEDRLQTLEKSKQIAKQFKKYELYRFLKNKTKDLLSCGMVDEVKSHSDMKDETIISAKDALIPSIHTDVERDNGKKKRSKSKIPDSKSEVISPVTMFTKVETLPTWSWLNERINDMDVNVFPIDNHAGYMVFVPQVALYIQAGKKHKVILDSLLNVQRWRICRSKGDKGLKLLTLTSKILLTLGEELIGEFVIRCELKAVGEKARVFGIEIPADIKVKTESDSKLMSRMSTKLLLLVKFDDKGLHDGNMLPDRIEVKIPAECFPIRKPLIAKDKSTDKAKGAEKKVHSRKPKPKP